MSTRLLSLAGFLRGGGIVEIVGLPGAGRSWTADSEADAGYAVCRIVKGTVFRGTGFLIDPHHILTNWHVAPVDGEIPSMAAEFRPRGLGGRVTTIRVNFGQCVSSSPVDSEENQPRDAEGVTWARVDDEYLDYALIELRASPERDRVNRQVKPIPFFCWHHERPRYACMIGYPTTIDYPRGEEKQITAGEIYEITDHKVKCRTEGRRGSSGSPILCPYKKNILQLYGLNHCGNGSDTTRSSRNQGIRAEAIMRDLVRRFSSVSTWQPTCAWEEGFIEASKAVCKITTADGRRGIGFLVSPIHIITNNHLLNDEQACRGAVAQFQLSGTVQVRVALDPTVDFVKSKRSGFVTGRGLSVIREDSLDYTLVTLQAGPQSDQISLQCRPIALHCWGDTQPITTWLVDAREGNERKFPRIEPKEIISHRVCYQTEDAPDSPGAPILGFLEGAFCLYAINHKAGPGALGQAVRAEAVMRDLDRQRQSRILSNSDDCTCTPRPEVENRRVPSVAVVRLRVTDLVYDVKLLARGSCGLRQEAEEKTLRQLELQAQHGRVVTEALVDSNGTFASYEMQRAEPADRAEISAKFVPEAVRLDEVAYDVNLPAPNPAIYHRMFNGLRRWWSGN